MAHPLDGCNAKLNRAHKHLEALHEELRRWKDSGPYAFRRVSDAQTGRHDFRLDIRREPDPDNELATLIGDLAHNLRSALDHLAWELMGHYGLPQTTRVEFPIFNDRAAYWKSGRNKRVGGLPATALALIDEVQPCNGGDERLLTLHEVDRVDKHRTVHAVGVVLAPVDEGLRFIVSRGTIVDHDIRFNEPLEHGANVGWVLTDPPQTAPQIQGRFRADVALDNQAGEMHLPHPVPLDDLLGAAERVEWLVNRFGPTFA